MNDKNKSEPSNDEFSAAPIHWSAGLLRTLVRLGLIIALASIAHFAVSWVVVELETAKGDDRMLLLGALAFLLLIYAALIAVPFVPGVEIGLSMMVLQGVSIVPFVYAATILGLMLAFGLGQFLPYRYLQGFLSDLRLDRAAKLVAEFGRLNRNERLALLRSKLPGRISPMLVNYRYLVIALLINLPGNAVVGGGGGISMIAGLSRVFSLRGYLVMALIAVAPVPLLFALFGPGYFEN